MLGLDRDDHLVRDFIHIGALAVTGRRACQHHWVIALGRAHHLAVRVPGADGRQQRAWQLGQRRLLAVHVAEHHRVPPRGEITTGWSTACSCPRLRLGLATTITASGPRYWLVVCLGRALRLWRQTRSRPSLAARHRPAARQGISPKVPGAGGPSADGAIAGSIEACCRVRRWRGHHAPRTAASGCTTSTRSTRLFHRQRRRARAPRLTGAAGRHHGARCTGIRCRRCSNSGSTRCWPSAGHGGGSHRRCGAGPVAGAHRRT